MNDQNYPSSQVMIKIDGARIRAIREEKGLTQLYIATVVDVTTDTVSRWENKRYPTIKKENGLKLAEALEVALEDILDTGEQEDSAEPVEEPAPAAERAEEGKKIGEPSSSQQAPGGRWYNIGHLTIVIVTVILIGAGMYLYDSLHKNPDDTGITVTRIVPPHFIAGQPLPVFLQVDKTDAAPVSIILKEDLPPGCILKSAAPPLSGSSASDIKWLTKITQSTLFFYTVVTDPTFSGDLSFSGVVKNGADENAVDIGGGSRSLAGLHHWADSNGDNRISDAEILMVYDLLAGGSEQIIDLDQVEEMWLGDGYVWNPGQQVFTIIE